MSFRTQGLALAMTMQDRTRSGTLPTATVMQFFKLHGLWDSRSAADWEMLFAQHAAPGLARRVLYKPLLATLTSH